MKAKTDDPILKDFLEKTNRAVRLLQPWFITRMMDDNWLFGLLLDTGHLLVIHKILDVKEDGPGGVWLDVEMARDTEWLADVGWAKSIIQAPTSRTTASVKASKIIMAFELADT
jgi:hypothetical protein